MGDRYLRTIMTFLGVPSYETIIIEGHNAEPHKTEEIKATSINNAENWQQHFNCYLHCVTDQTSYSVLLYTFPVFINIYYFHKFKI